MRKHDILGVSMLSAKSRNGLDSGALMLLVHSLYLYEPQLSQGIQSFRNYV